MQGFRSKAKAGATAFGSAFHDILAHTQHAEPGKQPKSLEQATGDYFKSLGTLTANVEEETTSMLAQIKMLIELYGKQWAKEQANWKFELREDTFRFPFELMGYPGSPRSIPLRGRFDGAFRRGGKPLWLLETKTKGRIDEEGIAKSLPFDTQTMLYCWAIKQRFGEMPSGTVYDVIRNPQLKQKQGETSIEFVDRIREDVVKRPEWYFVRFDVTLQPSDLAKWEKSFLVPVVRQIVEWWESIKQTPNDPFRSPLHFIRPGAFWSQYGRSDMFEAITSDNTFSLEKRKVVYPELED